MTGNNGSGSVLEGEPFATDGNIIRATGAAYSSNLLYVSAYGWACFAVNLSTYEGDVDQDKVWLLNFDHDLGNDSQPNYTDSKLYFPDGQTVRFGLSKQVIADTNEYGLWF